MAKNNKPESSRLNLFYVLQVLAHESDEEHPMTARQIKEKVDAEFGYLSETGAIISLDTVKRILDELTDRIFAADMDYEQLTYQYGFCIHCVVKAGNSYKVHRGGDEKISPKKYYYYESGFTPGEIRTLKDAVETYSYFSEDDVTEIIRKIIRLRPLSYAQGQYYDASAMERDKDSLLMLNIEDLNSIIHNRRCAKIEYCYYDYNKKLVCRKGYPKVIEPVDMMWSNGCYYLLAYNPVYDGLASYRIDRITDIEQMDVPATHRDKGLNPVQYRHKHPIMFGGETEHIELLCRDTGMNYIMNTLIDTFGKNVRVSVADDTLLQQVLKHDSRYYKEQGITWLKVVLDATSGGLDLWVTQFCDDCVVVSPKKLADRIKEKLTVGLGYYQI